jgi:hypothetical protein
MRAGYVDVLLLDYPRPGPELDEILAQAAGKIVIVRMGGSDAVGCLAAISESCSKALLLRGLSAIVEALPASSGDAAAGVLFLNPALRAEIEAGAGLSRLEACARISMPSASTGQRIYPAPVDIAGGRKDPSPGRIAA